MLARGRAQHAVEQAGKARVQILASQRVEARRPDLSLSHDAGLAQDLEVVGAGGLAHRHVDLAHRAFAAARDRRHDLQPHRVAQSMKDAAQLELFALGVWELFGYGLHVRSFVRRSSYFVLCSMTIVLREVPMKPVSNPLRARAERLWAASIASYVLTLAKQS